VVVDARIELKRAKLRGAANQVNREYVLPDGVNVLRVGIARGMPCAVLPTRLPACPLSATLLPSSVYTLTLSPIPQPLKRNP
jgi:hypothetical protein